jgi:hypothetical protein
VEAAVIDAGKFVLLNGIDRVGLIIRRSVDRNGYEPDEKTYVYEIAFDSSTELGFLIHNYYIEEEFKVLDPATATEQDAARIAAFALLYPEYVP